MILVVDSSDRLSKNFRGETGDGPIAEVTKSCLDKFAAIKKGGIPMGTDDPVNCHTISQL